jgi:curli biogenesis system outer membrane secretion channel CsgG
MSRATATSLVLFLTVITAAEAQQKKRVAVMNFDYATVQTAVNSLFGSNQDVGKGIADILVDRLVSDGAYSVIERKELDKVIGEQNFSNSDRADASSAAKLGRVLGVDAIIIGSITQFGNDDKKNDIAAGGVGNRLSKYGIGGLSRSKATAVVQITARMIDTSTAEILASVQGHGEESKSGTGILGSGGSYGGMASGALDMKSKNFRETILGAAVNKAVTDVANGLDQKAASLPTNTIQIDGLVADASPDGTVVINVGSQAGVKVGAQLLVKRGVRDITDPATGKVLRHVEDSIGTLTITEVDAQSAVGKFTGPGMPQVGDTVSNPR